MEKNADYFYKMEVNPRSESVKDRFFLQAYERIGQGHAIPRDILYIGSPAKCRELLGRLNAGELTQEQVKRQFQARQKHYKYFSTQRPVDIGTFPKSALNAPMEITNYDQRTRVEHGTVLAWGELIYAQPLTAKEQSDYELRPSRYNPDVWEHMTAQAQTVGKWEDAQKLPDPQRMTWWYPDFGSYVVKEHISREELDRRVEGIEMQREAAGRKRKKAPIAQQLKEAGKLAGASRRPEAPKKDMPDKGDR